LTAYKVVAMTFLEIELLIMEKVHNVVVMLLFLLDSSKVERERHAIWEHCNSCHKYMVSLNVGWFKLVQGDQVWLPQTPSKLKPRFEESIDG
jgi:hypothetical protein